MADRGIVADEAAIHPRPDIVGVEQSVFAAIDEGSWSVGYLDSDEGAPVGVNDVEEAIGGSDHGNISRTLPWDVCGTQSPAYAGSLPYLHLANPGETP